MNNSINNKLAFNIYVWLIFCLFLLAIGYLMILYIGVFTADKILIHEVNRYAFVLIIGCLSFAIFDYLINPNYIEMSIFNGHLCIKYFRSYKNSGLGFMRMIFYKKYLIEQNLDRQSYNNYKLVIDRLGFRKSLILQKIDNGKIYESKPINIGFLGVKKYTNLILSLDRLREKITMN